MINTVLNTANNCCSFIGLNSLGQSAADLYNKEYKSCAKNFSEGILRLGLTAATAYVVSSAYNFHQNSVNKVTESKVSNIDQFCFKIHEGLAAISNDRNSVDSLNCSAKVKVNSVLKKAINSEGFSKVANEILSMCSFTVRSANPLSPKNEFKEIVEKCISLQIQTQINKFKTMFDM